MTPDTIANVNLDDNTSGVPPAYSSKPGWEKKASIWDKWERNPAGAKEKGQKNQEDLREFKSFSDLQLTNQNQIRELINHHENEPITLTNFSYHPLFDEHIFATFMPQSINYCYSIFYAHKQLPGCRRALCFRIPDTPKSD